MIKFSISLKPYRHNAYIIICPNDEAQEYFEKNYKVTHPEGFSLFNGMYIPVNNMHFLWVQEFKLNGLWLSVVSHESLHMAYDILVDSGVVISRDSEEALTYYHQHILRQIIDKATKFLKK